MLIYAACPPGMSALRAEDRELTAESAHEEYDDSVCQHACAGQHDGQRKLYLMEKEFITSFLLSYTHDWRDVTVLYVGAAPGHHIVQLLDDFPAIGFVLFDTGRLNKQLCNHGRVEVQQRLFTDADAIMYADRIKPSSPLLFISDIRGELQRVRAQLRHTPTYAALVAENMIEVDMRTQERWFLLLNGHCGDEGLQALIKMRLPHHWPERPAGPWVYLKGRVLVQPFMPKSTECRLHVLGSDGNAMRVYDARLHEGQMFAYNRQRSTETDLAIEQFINGQYARLGVTAGAAACSRDGS